MKYGFPLLLTLVACNRSDAPQPTVASTSHTQESTSAHVASNAAVPVNPVAAGSTARVGSKAPEFALTDVAGKPVKLSDFAGKIVVLEWFNPGCPFVKRSHTVGSLVENAKKQTAAGVAWLAINSGGANREGAGAEKNIEGAKTFNMSHPILLDPAGAVGHAFGATNTPHMFVIDTKGTLVYGGAIDNSPDGEGQSPTGGKLINYVDAAIDAVKNGKSPETPETKAYGCSVKYAN